MSSSFDTLRTSETETPHALTVTEAETPLILSLSKDEQLI